MSTLRARLCLLVLSLSLSLGVSAAPDCGGDSACRAILESNDPVVAATFLNGDEAQTKMRSGNPELYRVVFARALEVKDLHQFLKPETLSLQYVRVGLFNRQGCSFCQKPGLLLSWTERFYPGYGEESKKLLRKGLWEWESLDPAAREYLKSAGISSDQWSKLEFSERQSRMRLWALAERDSLLRANPRNADEFESVQSRRDALWEILSGNEVRPVEELWKKSRQLIQGLEDARKRFSGNTDAPIRKLLLQAEQGASVDERLAALSALFDSAKVEMPALKAQAPARQDQKFAPELRELVSELLKVEILREIQGTWAGEELSRFYSKVPLVIRIERTHNNWLAWCGNGIIGFNEELLEQYVKSNGRGLDELAKDPVLLRGLVRDLAATFVHEARHQMQDVWSRDQGLDWITAQSAEQEAMLFQAFYVLEKSRKDPGYLEFLRKSSPSSSFSREALSMARRLESRGADAFRHSMMSTHYPHLASLERNVLSRFDWHGTLSKDVEAEMRRRESLPWHSRLWFALKGRGLKTKYSTRAELLEDIKFVSTEQLRLFGERMGEKQLNEGIVYAKHRDRLAEIVRGVETRLGGLNSGDKAAASAGSAVPVPRVEGKK